LPALPEARIEMRKAMRFAPSAARVSAAQQLRER